MQEKLRCGPSKLADHLGVRIATESLKAGDVLEREVDLAKRFNVSRSVVREALRILSSKGLVECRVKVGNRVRERRTWSLHDPQVLDWLLHDGPSAKISDDLAQIYGILAPEIAGLAAHSRSQKNMAAMSEALDRMSQHKPWSQPWMMAAEHYNREMLHATGNEVVLSLSAMMAAAVRSSGRSMQSGEDASSPMNHYCASFTAIVDRDASGARNAISAITPAAASAHPGDGQSQARDKACRCTPRPRSERLS